MAGQTEYHLGEIAERYESSGPGTISTGKGDHGGVSYGTYQFSTAEGTINDYLKNSAYKEDFKGLEPNTQAFNDKWRTLASTDSAGFAQDQHNFVKATHYDPQVERLKADGIDLSNRGPAVQEALWSTSVQYRGLTKNVFEKGLKEKFGEHYKLSELTDKDIVSAVQDYKIAHNEQLFRSSPSWWGTLHDRAVSEKEDLIALADGKPLPEHTHPHHAQGHAPDGHHSLLKQGMQGDQVRHAQEELQALGYLHGTPDGRFGPITQAAVEDFQRAQGLEVDGKIGPKTQQHLDAAVRDKQISDVTVNLPQLREFSDPSHPQNALYNTLRDGFPPGTSPELLSQATATCYMSGIRQPEDLGNVIYGNGRILFDTSSLFARPAQMDVNQAPPNVQQTMQQVQHFDQQQAQNHTQQQAQINAQQPQGPTPGGY
jgi:peptidoglycan hydrolase-like protein with peptidoglycan-binding domain